MGDLIEFPSDYDAGFEAFVAAWRGCVAQFGEPVSLFIPNEKRIGEFNRAVNLVREIAEFDGEIKFEFGLVDGFQNIGYISLEGELLMLCEAAGDPYSNLKEAIDLGDGVDIVATTDGTFVFGIAFHDVMIQKR